MAKVKTIKGMPFEKGKVYRTTKDLGLKPIEVRSGTVETNNEKVLFITIDYKYHNELHSDGIVHEPHNKNPIYPYGKIIKEPKNTYLFARHYHGGVFLYIGELDYTIRYDKKRNKMFIKDDRRLKSRVKAKKNI